jgi:hypothetical protein
MALIEFQRGKDGWTAAYALDYAAKPILRDLTGLLRRCGIVLCSTEDFQGVDSVTFKLQSANEQLAQPVETAEKSANDKT